MYFNWMTNPCAAFTMSSQPLRRPDQLSLILLTCVGWKFELIAFCFWIAVLKGAVKGYDWEMTDLRTLLGQILDSVKVKIILVNFFSVNYSDENELPFDFYETNTFGCNLSEFVI